MHLFLHSLDWRLTRVDLPRPDSPTTIKVKWKPRLTARLCNQINHDCNSDIKKKKMLYFDVIQLIISYIKTCEVALEDDKILLFLLVSSLL